MSMQNVEDVYALSPMQEGMLFHTVRAPRSGVFVEQYCCTLAGALDVSAFRAAWDDTVGRHPALRTAFLWDGLDEPLQVVRGEVEVPWTLEDWRGLVPDALERRWEELLRTDRAKGLDLAQAPVMRMALVRTDEAAWRFLWTFHHVLSDGWSTPLVLQDVFAAYAARRQDRMPELTAPRPYRDFIAWLDSRDPRRAEAFWKAGLAGFSAPTPLGVDRTGRPRRQGHDQHLHALTPEATESLRVMARRHRVTLNTVVQGAWALLLHRYSGADDVVYGMTDSGRPAELEGVERMIGLFISTLPVRARMRPDDHLASWLGGLQAQLVEIRQFAYTPLVDIQRASDVPAGDPLFESIVVFENYPAAPTDRLEGLGLEIRDVRYIEQSNFPLALLAVPGESLEFILVYDTARFDDEAVARMAGHLDTLLAGFVADPEGRLADLPLLTGAERQRLLHDWQPTGASYDDARTVVDRIDAQAERRPDAVAVAFEEQTLTYGALRRRAGRVARALHARGVGPDVPVGLCMDRSVELAVGVLGILKAGGAYVPLDPEYPADRLRFMLDDARAPVVLTRRALADAVPESDAIVLFLEDALEEAGAASDPLPAPEVDRTAYVIYTSGSTGRPKGVEVTHRNLMHSTAARISTYREPVGAFLLLSSFAFDSSVAGLFWTLATGGTLVLPRARQEQDLDALAALVARHEITHTLTLPSLYGLLLEHAPPERLASLRTVIVAGEACPPSLVARHHRLLPGAALYNEYGPTETTVWCTVHRTEARDADGPVPIGRPIDRTQVYVLDALRRPVPVGVAGELYVGGAGVTRGYRDRPTTTAERFVEVDLPGLPARRLYRTGDRACYRADGVLEFLGRVDQQVKIRGYRIEPEEIEAVLKRHPSVREAVVVARQGEGTAATRLAAYVVASGEAEAAVWRAFLSDQLPDYMVPAVFVPLAELPRLPNGKVDVRALPAPEASAASEAAAAYVAPRTPEEERLAKVWAEVLGLERVGVHDHFFELGGDSILSIQVISRARQAGLTLTPHQFFEHPTVAGLAAVVRSDAKAEEASVVAGPAPLTPIQHWFFDVHRAAPHHWNQAYLLELPPDDGSSEGSGERAGALRAAVRAVVEHHDVLRTAFRREADGWTARIEAPPFDVPFERVSVAAPRPGEREQAIEAVTDSVQASFDLAGAPLFRAVLFDAGAGRPGRLLLVAHHLVVDAVSWSILLADLAAAYAAARKGEPIALPGRTTSVVRWATYLEERARDAGVRSELPYWRSQQAGAAPLPVERQAAEPATEAGARTVAGELDADATRALLTDVHAAYTTRINEVLLAALAQTLASWTGTETVHLDVEGHGRDPFDEGGGAPDLSRTVGWFTAVYPVRLDLPPDDDPGTVLKAVKEQLRGVPNGGLGYGVLRYLTDDASEALRSFPRPGLLFNYLGNLDRTLSDVLPFRRPRPVNRSARSALSERPYRLELNAFVSGGRFQIGWTYDGRTYAAETIEDLAHRYLDALRALIDHCTTTGAGGYTPSDFPEAGLGQDDLDRFLDRLS